MSKRRLVWTEVSLVTGLAFRIFKNVKQLAATLGSSNSVVAQMTKASATDQIRRQVFARDNYACVHCTRGVTWATGQMDEKKSKGDGGEVSVANCQTLCPKCHILPGGKHDRHPRFGRAV